MLAGFIVLYDNKGTRNYLALLLATDNYGIGPFISKIQRESMCLKKCYTGIEKDSEKSTLKKVLRKTHTITRFKKRISIFFALKFHKSFTHRYQ